MNWFFFALISAVFSAAAAISQKKTLFHIDGIEFSFIVTLFGLIFTIPFLFFIDYNLLNSHLFYTNILILYLKTIPGALAFLCVMLSIKNLEISKALPLLALTPGLVAVVAFFVLGDRLSTVEVIGLVCLFIGTYLIETKQGQKIWDPIVSFFTAKSYKYVLAALFLFTITSVADRLLLGKYKLAPNVFISFQQFFLLFNFLIIVLAFRKNPIHIIRNIDFNIYKWIFFIAFLTVIYRYTEILAVKNAPVALVLSIKRISVFLTVIIGGKLFKESNLLLKAFATAIILTGIFLIAG